MRGRRRAPPRTRAGFVASFCERPFFFIRAATPQVLLDEVDRSCSRPGCADAHVRLRSDRRRWPRRSRCSRDARPEARVLAGGTDLIIRLRDGSLQPALVVDVKRIAELRPGIASADGVRPRIGAGR